MVFGKVRLPFLGRLSRSKGSATGNDGCSNVPEPGMRIPSKKMTRPHVVEVEPQITAEEFEQLFRVLDRPDSMHAARIVAFDSSLDLSGPVSTAPGNESQSDLGWTMLAHETEQQHDQDNGNALIEVVKSIDVERVDEAEPTKTVLKADAPYQKGVSIRIEDFDTDDASEEFALKTIYLCECIVCGKEKAPTRFPSQRPTSRCTHPIQTCSSCMRKWIMAQYITKGPADFTCPQCPSNLSFSDVQLAASNKIFKAYERSLIANALGSVPEFSWCLNPDGCDSGQINIYNDQSNRHRKNFMECVECKWRQCTRHQGPWHAGEDCEEFEYRTSGRKAHDEKATEEMLDTVSKLCPNPCCGWRLEKVGGCDHVKCKKCRFEFCWQCLVSQYEIRRLGNKAHKPWCEFHSDLVETSWPFNNH